MISPPPRSSPICATARPAAAPPPWLPGHEGDSGEGEGEEALVLKGGVEATGEGSYRLKRRFEGGSHGEVRQRNGGHRRLFLGEPLHDVDYAFGQRVRERNLLRLGLRCL